MDIATKNLHRASRAMFPWGTSRRYNSYADYIKNRFGSRVQKVIVDAGFTCPNRDGHKGYGGCTYCNNDSFTPSYSRSEIPIREQVEKGIEFLTPRYKVDRFIVYFQPYSNTYAPLEKLKPLYQEALAHPRVIGLTLGTRPDCIDEAKLAYLEQLAREYFITIEYGLESPYEKTLEWINRQHDFRCWEDAVRLTAGRGIHICTHIILGFPTESREEMIGTAGILSRYPMDSLKIHHLHIVKKTILAEKYEENPFPLLAYHEYIDLVSEFLQHLRPDVKVQRLAGDTPPRLLIGPDWGVRASELQKKVETEMRGKNVWQGKLHRR